MSAFRIVDLEQGTDAWLEWRRGGIGASEAPAIMGENPWKSAASLLREKTGQARGFAMNAAMARGTRLEPQARKQFNKTFKADVAPACLQNTRREWMRASVDGLSSRSDRVVEIKCGERVYEHAARTGAVPRYYVGQLQHILCVTGLLAIDFFVYLPRMTPLHLTVARDDDYIERLIAAEAAFWSRVLDS